MKQVSKWLTGHLVGPINSYIRYEYETRDAPKNFAGNSRGGGLAFRNKVINNIF